LSIDILWERMSMKEGEDVQAINEDADSGKRIKMCLRMKILEMMFVLGDGAW
jgi:hypothetical protein